MGAIEVNDVVSADLIALAARRDARGEKDLTLGRDDREPPLRHIPPGIAAEAVVDGGHLFRIILGRASPMIDGRQVAAGAGQDVIEIPERRASLVRADLEHPHRRSVAKLLDRRANLRRPRVEPVYSELRHRLPPRFSTTLQRTLIY